MAEQQNTPARAGRKPKGDLNAFMVKLFDPLPDAELADPEILRLEKRAARRRWEAGFNGVRAARHARTAASYRGVTQDDKAEWDRVMLEYFAAVDRQFSIPAPDEKALKWKRSVIMCGMLVGARYLERQLIVAEDELRITRMNARAAA